MAEHELAMHMLEERIRAHELTTAHDGSPKVARSLIVHQELLECGLSQQSDLLPRAGRPVVVQSLQEITAKEGQRPLGHLRRVSPLRSLSGTMA